MNGPTSDEALAGGAAQGSKGIAQSVSYQSTAADRKRQETLIAQAAWQGISAWRLADGGWIVSKWNLTKEVSDADIESWLERAGVVR